MEEREGLSSARNRGISESNGDIVAFIDDDANADPGWLANLMRVHGAHPTAAAVGGRIQLHWDTEIPSWLHPDLTCYLGELNLGEGEIALAPHQYLFGGNLSVKREFLDRCGGFSTDLGRNSRTLLSGEEIELLLRLRAVGAGAVYSSAALVHHPAPANRLTKRFMRRRAYWGARSDARMLRMHSLMSRSRDLWPRIVRLPAAWLRSLSATLRGYPAAAFFWTIQCWSTFGYIVEEVRNLYVFDVRARNELR